MRSTVHLQIFDSDFSRGSNAYNFGRLSINLKMLKIATVVMLPVWNPLPQIIALREQHLSKWWRIVKSE
ncbi:hypothetical protein [Nostoc sp. UHCC 0251]|uniref:hypothetical protein n=1 Tax=Nostoc sp. UHCC 0251 TaxID=3110240 RepID=UPI002B1EB949|nr:hypothetical protein [Nostoc sp. UHCC 0251]MEA5627253.1 hypothetical protein [Nostoc sp. UHCC 0251]